MTKSTWEICFEKALTNLRIETDNRTAADAHVDCAVMAAHLADKMLAGVAETRALSFDDD